MKYQHAQAVPTAMAIPGGVLPLDLALGVALPVHYFVALNLKWFPDYVPTKAAPARARLLGLTCLTLAGLFTLNPRGGITRTA